MRTWFVGLLFAIGAILFANKGYSPREDFFLNIAGVFAWLIALFPMRWTGETSHFFWMHGISACIFFGATACVAAFCSDATVDLINDPVQRKRYKTIYRLVAVSMFVSPVVAFLMNVYWNTGHKIFWAELCGISAFGIYWIVKGIEMSGPDTERIVAEGRMYTPPKLNIKQSVKRMLTPGPNSTPPTP